MSRAFEWIIDRLSRESGYPYDYLVDRYNEIMDDGGDVNLDQFIGITMEHDW